MAKPISKTALYRAIDRIGGPYQFSPALDCPSAGEPTARLDPWNPDGVDYPDCAGGTATWGYDMSRAWIWGGKACLDEKRGRVVWIGSPHPFDKFGPPPPGNLISPGNYNSHLTMLWTYTFADNRLRVYEAPLNSHSERSADYWPRGVAHTFDNQCIVGDVLYKATLPVWMNNQPEGEGWKQYHIARIALDRVTNDLASAREGAAYIGSFPMSDKKVTAGGMDYIPGWGIFHGHKDRYWRINPTTGLHTPNDALGTPLGFAVPTIHNLASYHRDRSQLLYGGGALAGIDGPTGRNLEWITIDTAGVVRHIDRSPVCLSMSETDIAGEVKGVIVPDPNSREWIGFHDSGVIYGCDPDRPAGQHWRVLRTETAQVDIACPLWGMGAILCFKSFRDGGARISAFRAA
jgi:hypothetical protein